MTTKLQHEVRFVVAGTRAELFMLPCKYTAIRCTHLGMEQNKFTYDPERPAQQFEQYLKLTFANSLKKAGLVADTFEFSSLRYSGPDIHTLMRAAEQERFVLPKEDFMRLNRRQVAATRCLSAVERKEKTRSSRGTSSDNMDLILSTLHFTFLKIKQVSCTISVD